MRLAIAVDNGFVSEHFRRCSQFLIVDLDENKNIVKQELVENPGAYAHQPGLVPNFLSTLGVNCIIAGGMGPRAVAMFESMGIQVILGVSGRIQDVLNAFIAGTLKGGENLCEHPQEGTCGHH